MTEPAFFHPQGPLALPTGGAAYLGSYRMVLGRQSQKCPSERPERTGWWRFGWAASLAGRCSPVDAPTFTADLPPPGVTANAFVRSSSGCRPLLPLRMVGAGAGVGFLASWDPTAMGLRMAGVTCVCFLWAGTAGPLRGRRGPGCRHLPASATSVSTSTRRRSCSLAAVCHAASVVNV